MVARRSGYTLVEILVVIAVIGILAAMLLPVIGLLRERGVRTSCLSNMRSVGLGFQAYAADDKNRGYFPHEDRDSLPIGTGPEGGNHCWFDRIDPYMGTVNLSRAKQCPGWDGYADLGTDGSTPDLHSIKMNSKLENGIDTTTDPEYPANPALKKFYFFPAFRYVRNAGQLVLVFDGRTDSPATKGHTDGHIGSVDHVRHSGATNMTFCDGSTRSIDGPAADPNGWTDEGGLTWDPY